MSWTFNPPPGWPVPPGFTPPEGWVPDPEWPRAPEDWTYWVEAADTTGAQAPPEPDLDPYRVPPPGQAPAAPGFGYAGAAPAAYGAPTSPPPPTVPGYGAGGYGAGGYGPPPYGAPAYGPQTGYLGGPAPRQGVRGWVVGLIIGVVVLLVVTVAAGVFAIGRLASTTIKPAIQSDMACSDALAEIRDDDVPPTPFQAQAALPGLQDAQTRAQESADKSTFVNPKDVLAPIQVLVSSYTVLAALPSNSAVWTPEQRNEAQQESVNITRAKRDLENSCGTGSFGNSGGGSGVSGVSLRRLVTHVR